MSFSEVVDKNFGSCVRKMNLLRKYVAGPPLGLIQGYFVRPTESAYSKARASLRARYGKDDLLSKSILDKLESWPKIGSFDDEGVQKFSDFLQQVVETKLVTAGLEHLDNSVGNKNLARILPGHLINKWRTEVSTWKEGSDRNPSQKPRFPPFEHFARFVKKEADCMDVPELSGVYNFGKRATGQRNSNSTADYTLNNDKIGKRLEKIATTFGANANVTFCMHCKGEHHINECDVIAKIESFDAKRKIYWDNFLCYGCGAKGGKDHSVKICRNKATCQVCQKSHSTCLHDKNRDKPDEVRNLCTEICDAHGANVGVEHSLIVPVRVRSKSNPEVETECYCVLDSQSTGVKITTIL